jgi:hypothetical protein
MAAIGPSWTIVGNRQYTQRETRLLSEYLALTRANQRKILNPKLGPQTWQIATNSGAAASSQLQSPTMMYADAAVLYPDHVELWEAKIVLDGRAIGQLLEYQLALPQSPESVSFRSLPSELHIVAAAARPTALQLCAQVGITVHMYTPAWALEDFASWYQNLTKPIVGASAPVTA